METKKIKILRIINRFNIGGPTFNATFLTQFLSDEFETMLVGGLPEQDEADSLHIPEMYGVKPVLIPEMKRNPDFRSDRKAYKRLCEIIREFKPDIVHTHAAKAGALGRRAARSCGVPVIVHTFHGHVFHGYFSPWKTYLFKQIERRLAKQSSRIVAISPKQKHELVEVHRVAHAGHVHVVNLGFDLGRFRDASLTMREDTRRRYHLTPDEIAIAIVGRLAPIKDHDFFFDVLESIKERTSKKVRVFVVGDGEERERVAERACVFEGHPQVQVELTSWIKDIASFNAGMDIIALTSKNEGTPVSLIEAQASGVPVISTDVGGVRDVVLDEKTGFVVTQGDKVQYTEKMLELIEDDELRESMRPRGWEFVKEQFHYTSLVDNMAALYKELLSEHEQK